VKLSVSTPLSERSQSQLWAVSTLKSAQIAVPGPRQFAQKRRGLELIWERMEGKPKVSSNLR